MQSVHEMQEAKAEQDRVRRQEKREHKDKRKVEKLIKFLGYDTTNFTEDELQQLREYIMQTVVLGQQKDRDKERRERKREKRRQRKQSKLAGLDGGTAMDLSTMQPMKEGNTAQAGAQVQIIQRQDNMGLEGVEKRKDKKSKKDKKDKRKKKDSRVSKTKIEPGVLQK